MAPTPELNRPGKPVFLEGVTQTVVATEGTDYVTINERDGQPFQVFADAGKARSSVQAMAEAMGRLISLSSPQSPPEARFGVLKRTMSLLWYIGGAESVGFGSERLISPPDAIARAMADYLVSRLPAEAQT
jgi:ribonucleoside-diphosphate reductase alpha chain